MKIATGSALFKAFTVTLVGLALLIPLGMLSGLVNERAQLREEAVKSVAQGWGGRQMLGGIGGGDSGNSNNDDGRW